MSTHTTFAIFGTGGIGSFIIDEFLKLKENGAIFTVKIASRSVGLKIYHTSGIYDLLICGTAGFRKGITS